MEAIAYGILQKKHDMYLLSPKPPEEALQELHMAWEGVKESYRQQGNPIPAVGKYKKVN